MLGTAEAMEVANAWAQEKKKKSIHKKKNKRRELRLFFKYVLVYAQQYLQVSEPDNISC